jgi:TPR repeat protein
MIDQARALIAARRWTEAAELLRPLTGTGDPEIDYVFGSLLFGGDDCVSPAEALAALRRAAALNHPAACYRVATLTIDGGVVTGPVVDLDLLMRAASLGDVDALRHIALAHVYGDDGFARDLNAAREWYERAAERGQALSQYDLAFMLLRGDGGPADIVAGLRWLERAATQRDVGSSDAARLLANAFELGWFDVTPDPAAARHWRDRERELGGCEELDRDTD